MHDGPRYVVEVQESAQRQSAKSDLAQDQLTLTFVLELISLRAWEKGLVGMARGQRIATVVDGSASCIHKEQGKSEDRGSQRLLHFKRAWMILRV